MDWATQKVLAWRLSNTPNASLFVEAVNERSKVGLAHML
jgi:hypothetical protein